MVKKRKTILFIDIDNTIVSNPFETAVFPVVATKISEKTGKPPETIKKMFLLENRSRKNDIVNPISTFDWDDILGTVAKRFGVELELSVEHLVRQYACAPYISILGKADIILGKMRKPHRLIVATTNGLSKYQLPVLRALEIDKLFDDFLAPDITHALKGHKAFYGDFLDRAEVAISVGDSYDDDIVGPKNLGMHTVWLNASKGSAIKRFSPFERVQSFESLAGRKVHPDAIILNLAELPSVVNKIEEQCIDF